jgi:hypothetical protein
MKLRFLVVVLALAMPAVAAQAQIGLYLNPVVTRVTNSTADTGPFAFLGSGATSRIFGGVDFGGYYTFVHEKSFDVSADMRDALVHGNSASLNSFLVGLRVASHPVTYGLKPYVQLSVGAGRTESPLNPVHINRLEYDLFVGVDKSLNKHVDWRPIEVGYGSVSTISSGIYGGGTAVPAARLLNFSTGFVFRF